MVKVIGFSAEYVETMTPGERKLYWSYFERDEAEKRKAAASANNGVSIGTPIDSIG